MRPLFSGIWPVVGMRARASSSTASTSERRRSSSGDANRSGKARLSGVAFRTPLFMCFYLVSHVYRFADRLDIGAGFSG